MIELFKDLVIPIAGIVAAIIVAYFTATYAVRRETAHGKLRLLEICRRYVLNFINAFDLNSRKVRSDPLTYQLYVQELGKIVDDLDSLLGNVYVEKLILEYPRITKLLVILRRELLEHKYGQSQSLRALNQQSITEIFDLMAVIRKDLGGRTTDDFDEEIIWVERALREAGIVGALPNQPLQPTSGVDAPS